jgi:DNA invertase Pin-like site-specific DNA recombinase
MRQMVGRKPKLTPEQARQVREWAALGRTPSQVARRFGIGVTTLKSYIRREHKREEYA